MSAKYHCHPLEQKAIEDLSGVDPNAKQLTHEEFQRLMGNRLTESFAHVGWRFTHQINYGQGQRGESDWIYTDSLEDPLQFGSQLAGGQVMRAERLFVLVHG